MQTATPTAPAATVPPPAPAGTTYVVERPPPGIARGQYPVPPWVVAILALLLVAGIVAYFVLRHRRAQRARRYESVAPISVPPSSRPPKR
jgi:hypothetical protein